MKKLLASAAALAVALPLTATAGNFNGFFAGVGLGVNGFSGNYTQTTTAGGGDTFKSDMGKTIFDGALLAGYGKLFGQMYVGGELALSLSAGNAKASDASVGSSYKVTPGWGVRPAVRLGFLASPNTIAFVSLGAAAKRFQVNATTIAGLAGAKKSQTHWGFSTGAGLETFITEKVSLRGEYIFTAYANKNYTITSTDTGKLKPRDNLFRLGVTYNF